ncbi:NADP-dependent oxidoreductase domain-containing protein [Colletotrichum navitas]|uniref:NADP-dependent oxidoreductase domain-containing protein n=1 Tax=Colletotrichum navitas TaxID=681940 RepID=A0AAD8PTQ6_9PEZI|nr:NADP-dependent oxidoreductase domain-containing protein [Colletotrichum navitas]KAK1579914.1 NADP-dependent oxidoreductase domain-containing protein [Colletotrichum navitas]
MGVDYVDLYYVHRLDPKMPVEKTMELMTGAKNSIRRAYTVAPVDAVQVEYNPFQLDIENETGTNLLSACREFGITVFAYAPLGRGFLTAPTTLRPTIRFSPANFAKNPVLVNRFKALADKKGCTPGQLALAWLSAQGEDIMPIPGTKKLKYMVENVGALKVHLSKVEVQEIRDKVEKAEVVGKRNPLGMFTEYSVTVEL